MTKKFRLLLALALVPAAFGLTVSDAQAAQFQFPYEPNPANQCTNDFITWEGDAQLILETTPNPDGTIHVKEHFNTMGIHGVGALGNYVYNEVTNSMQEYDVTMTTLFTSHTTHHLHLMHQENNLPNDDRYERVHVHVVFNNGVPQVYQDQQESECR